MQMVINTRGSYLCKKDGNFLVSTDEKKVEVSPKKVSSILITTAVAVSTDAIYLAMKNNIEIVLLNYSGEPFARVWHCKPGSTNMIRRKQLHLDKCSFGLEIAKEWLKEKNLGRVKLLKQLNKRRDGMAHLFNPAIKELRDAVCKIESVKGCSREKRAIVMGYEGHSGRLYFDVISKIVPEKFAFKGRSKHPAKDPFNAMLNYAYGVLYSRVESACIIAGLDPYIGILHTDNFNKVSLVYDIIEMFRPWVEETVIFLFTGRKVKDEFFKEVKNGILLGKDGKQVLIGALNDMFEKSQRYNGRNVKRYNIILGECHRIANRILGEVGD